MAACSGWLDTGCMGFVFRHVLHVLWMYNHDAVVPDLDEVGKYSKQCRKMKLVTVILFVCLSLTEIRSKEKGDKNNLPDKTDSPEYCKNEIVFFLSVLRLCTTYRRILYSKSRVKNWAGLDKNIQAALHIADSNIPGGKPGSRKDGSKDSSGNNGSKQQSDCDNGPEKLSYEDTDFGTDGYIGFFYNEEKSGDSDEDGKENLDDDDIQPSP
ncbi:uncharacterized protein LOC124253910 [Haliotis rubra]|uniref:uncharacterized protein LOC124253910 n=1 Tax=Haliotis rubra TaxID=36100 RepID=UPI001EE4F8B1|nr:uncharacterized protein LOC124253910 [Haliotis rubra]XP_046543719.1 uncharacterized protein LOC124253910 [Haliotis rubra]